MSWLPYLFVLLVLALIRLSFRRALGQAVRQGDEDNYIKCGAQADPYSPNQFLRVPLMAWLSKQAHRFSGDPEQALRSATGVASTMSILASMISAQVLGGLQAALLIGLLLAVMPGRIILSHHIWPDIWLGLWLSLVCLILIYPGLPPNLRTLLVGAVAALAFLTRFDALLLAPFVGFSLAPLPVWHWLFILLPTVTVFAILSIRNARRYQIPWPDNTWMFNLMIAARETDYERPGQVQIEHNVQKVLVDWEKLTFQDRLASSVASLRRLMVRPVRAFLGLLTRAWATLGPDSFVLHRLLPPDGVAYPEISRPFSHGLRIALIIAFPMFVSATMLALMVAGPPASVILWPTLALAASSLIHNRTRNRQAWLPGAALLLAQAASESSFWPVLLSGNSVPAWIVSIGIAVALICFRVRPDLQHERPKASRLDSGWGGVSYGAPKYILAPASVGELMQNFATDESSSFLGHGLGRSYGDCALNAGGALIDCRFLDRFLAFDRDNGILYCEAGVILLEINRLLSTSGWMLPVVPGTQFVTVGGAIANDVHGKNHPKQGTFGAHLVALTLARSNGDLLECSPENNTALFAATVGGLGLTGLILSAKIQLRPVRSLSMIVNRIPFKNLETLFSLAVEHQKTWEYSAAWLDPATGCRSGRFITANHAKQPGNLNWPRRRRIPLEVLASLPNDLPGKLMMKAANLWYRKGIGSDIRLASAESVLYPLDRLPGWNALFGKPGFYQHQSVLPEPVALAALDELLRVVDDGSQPAMLAVGKWFGPCTSPGLLSFPIPGFSLALDFANHGLATRRLMDALDKVVAGYNGRLYPAKDARMSPSMFASGYPKLEQFAQQVDPRFASNFWRRMVHPE